MPRYSNPADINFYQSQPISAGQLFFYESGTNTLKTTYADVAETIPNTNPVILDAAGREPDIWFQGTAKVVLRTSVDSGSVLVWERDPVGGETLIGNWSDWESSIVYNSGDIVIASNGCYYQSVLDDNIGNDPAPDNGLSWQEIILPTAESLDPVRLRFLRS